MEENKWEKSKVKIGLIDQLKPLLINLVLIIEEEKKKTVKKIEEIKDILEKSN